jgi:DNA-binding NtrC family response regulator
MTRPKTPSEVTGFRIKSPAMLKVYEEIRDYALHGRRCIILGSPGVGKEYAARYYYEKYKEERDGEGSIDFFALNCSGLSLQLAHSELFGHIKWSFSDAKTDKDGLFKVAKGSVLFLDEIGDLDRAIQPMLNRALDPEYGEASPLGSNDMYDTTDVTVICATEQPKHKIRPSLLDRLDKQVTIPTLDERKEDLPDAVEYFARKALIKRRDVVQCLQAVQGLPCLNPKSITMTNKHVWGLAKNIGDRLIDMVYERSWPGNFRALRIAIDTAVIRAKVTEDKELFLSQVEGFFREHRTTYSAPIDNAKYAEAHAKSNDMSPKYADIMEDSELLSRVRTALPRENDKEREKIVCFLESKKGEIFKASELNEAMGKVSRKTVQIKLNKLIKAQCIVREGARGDLYYLKDCGPQRTPRKFKKDHILKPPEALLHKDEWEEKLNEICAIVETAHGVFISGKAGAGKNAFMLALAQRLNSDNSVYYYSCESGSMDHLLGLLDNEIIKRDMRNKSAFHPEDQDRPEMKVAILTGFVEYLFREDERPIFVIDHVNDLEATPEREALKAAIRLWENITFVISGEKLVSDLQTENKDILTEQHFQ